MGRAPLRRALVAAVALTLLVAMEAQPIITGLFPTAGSMAGGTR